MADRAAFILLAYSKYYASKFGKFEFEIDSQFDFIEAAKSAPVYFEEERFLVPGTQKMRIPDSQTGSSLAYAGVAFLLHNPELFAKYKHLRYIPEYYNALSLYRRPGELFYTSTSSFMEHSPVSSEFPLVTRLDQIVTTPQFMRFKDRFGMQPVIVQNVKDGTLTRTSAVVKGWIENTYNRGYDVTPLSSVESGEIFQAYQEYFYQYPQTEIYAAILPFTS